MLKLLFITTLLGHSFVWAKAPQDIIIKSRFDAQSSKVFIDQLRDFLMINKLGDPYNIEVGKPLVVDLAKVIEEMPVDSHAWIKQFQSFFRLRAFESDFKLVVEGLGFSIGDFNSEFIPSPSTSGRRIEYVTQNSVHGIKVFAKKIAFEVILQTTDGSRPISFQVELIRPAFTVSQDLVLDLPMGWSTSILSDHLLLSLHTIDLKKIISEMIKKPHLIDFDSDELILPNLAVKVGNKTIRFDNAKIRDFLEKKEAGLKKSVLDLLNSRMNDRMGNVIKDTPLELKLLRKIDIQSDIHAAFELETMSANQSKMLEFNVDSYFCPPKEEKNNCIDSAYKVRERRVILEEQTQRSSRLLNRQLIERTANIAFSVSENYLNELILATIKAGLWEHSFKGKEFKLGPEAAFILADEAGDTLSLYLDIINPLKGAQRVLVGRSEIRFPIKLKIILRVMEKRGVPHLVIKVKSVDVTDGMLIWGLPAFGLPSTVGSVPRFRKKVVQIIKEDLAELTNTELIDLELEELKGSYAERLKFSSDGMGRANATINFQPEQY
jgi:hypothetical protein